MGQKWLEIAYYKKISSYIYIKETTYKVFNIISPIFKHSYKFYKYTISTILQKYYIYTIVDL